MSKHSMKRKMNTDGWSNFVSGQGRRGYDKTESNFFSSDCLLDDRQLSDIYTSEGIGSKIITRPANDATRRWFTLDNDENGEVFKEQARLRLQQKTNEAIVWARLYGGAIIVMDIDDGRDPSEPVGNIKTINKLRVYDRTRVTLHSYNFNTDPQSSYFEDPEILTVNRISGTPFDVHISRCLVFKGKKAPVNESSNRDIDTWFWGLSELQHQFDTLKKYGSTEKGVANVMEEFIISVYKIKNLSEIISGGDEETKQLHDRMDIIQSTKSILNGIFLDSDMEDFTRNTANIGGVAEIIDRFQMGLSAVSEIPVAILFGTSPAGLNASGDFVLTSYYDSISANQNNNISYTIMPCLNIISGYANKGEEVEINWLPLYEPSEKEKAEIRKLIADTDKLYVDMLVLSPTQVLNMRWNNGAYTTDMTLHDEQDLETELSAEELEKTDNLDDKTMKKIKKRFFGKKK